MKIRTVTYSKKYVTGPYLNHQPGFEADLEEGEDPVAALLELKALADKFDRATNNFEDTLVPVIQPERFDTEPINELPEDQRITALISDINSCKDIKVLESYRFIVKQNDQLQAAYDLKMKELTT